MTAVLLKLIDSAIAQRDSESDIFDETYVHWAENKTERSTYCPLLHY